MTPSTARAETELVMLLGVFVQMLPTEATIDPNDINFRRIIRELRDKAPKAAQAIAQAIQDNEDSDPSQKPAVEEASSVSKQGLKWKLDGSLTSSRLAKRKAGGSPADQSHLSKDTSYKDPVVSLVFGESPEEEPLLLSNKTLSESGSGEESRSTTSEAVDSKLIVSDQSKIETLLQNDHASAAMAASDHDALTPVVLPVVAEKACVTDGPLHVILVLKLSYRARVTFCRSPQVQRNRLLPAHRETGINKKPMGSRPIPSIMVWKETPLSFIDSLARNTA
ncbi:hypothetical protein BJX62DRAFT_236517 [Aspergillus germanicus]